MSVARDTVSDSIDAVSDAAAALNCDGSAVAAARGSSIARTTAVLSTNDARPMSFVAALLPATMRPMSKISASRLVVIDVVFVCSPLLGIATRIPVIFAIWRLIAATARHAGVCALASHGTTSHTMSVVAVQAVFTPPVHVEAAAHAAHGALPEAENAMPATHAVIDGTSLHTTSVVAVQAVFTPPRHVGAAAHATHGALPEAENAMPAPHGTTALHTMSVVAVQAVFTPAVHVGAAAHAAHGALPETEKVVPATHATWHTVSDVLVQAVFTPVVHVASTAHAVHSAFPDAEKVVPAAHACEEK